MCPCTDREEGLGVPGGQVPGTSEEEIDPTRNQSGREAGRGWDGGGAKVA